MNAARVRFSALCALSTLALGAAPCATARGGLLPDQPFPTTEAGRREFIEQWGPVHRRAVTDRARALLQCNEVELQIVASGPMNDPEEGERRSTSWSGAGCGKRGHWVVYCPPFQSWLGLDLDVPKADSGRVACAVQQLASYNENRPNEFDVTDVGMMVVVDGPTTSAQPTGEAPPPGYPDD